MAAATGSRRARTTSTLADGIPSEAHVQFATVAGDRLVTRSGGGCDDGGCPGRLDIDGPTSADVVQLRDPIERLLPDIPVPELHVPPPPP